MKYRNIFAILLATILIAGCNDEEKSTLEKPSTPEGDGRVICYANDGVTEVFNHVGSFVNNGTSGFTLFIHLSSHPDYKKGNIKFSPAWKCIIEDW